MYDFGSPGKAFLLDEKSLEFYLESLENKKNAIFRFAKGAGGLKQIQKISDIQEKELLKKCYNRKVA